MKPPEIECAASHRQCNSAVPAAEQERGQPTKSARKAPYFAGFPTAYRLHNGHLKMPRRPFMRRQLTVLIALCLIGVSVSAQSRRFGNRGVTVYADPDFRGESATFRDDTPDMRGYGLNDKVSSIEVPNGDTWEICQDIHFGNRCQIISGSISNLREIGWNDRI